MGSSIALQELRETQSGGARAEHENRGPELGRDLLQAVAGAGCGLEKGCVDVAQVVDLEYLSGGVCAVLGEAAVYLL